MSIPNRVHLFFVRIQKKREMLPIPYLIFGFLLNCAMTLVSPGINSNHRLTVSNDYHFQEAHRYGRNFYQNSAFFVEERNWPLVIEDTNNATLETPPNFPKTINGEKQITLLFENCFDKDKINDPLSDSKNYKFSLNQTLSEIRYSYLYPYSYVRRGTSIEKWKPYYYSDPYRHKVREERTGDDYLACVRTLVVFDKSSVRTGANTFQIRTANDSLLTYTFLYERSFVPNADEPWSMRIR